MALTIIVSILLVGSAWCLKQTSKNDFFHEMAFFLSVLQYYRSKKIEEQDRDRDISFEDEARFETFHNKISMVRNYLRHVNQNFRVAARPRRIIFPPSSVILRPRRGIRRPLLWSKSLALLRFLVTTHPLEFIKTKQFLGKIWQFLRCW